MTKSCCALLLLVLIAPLVLCGCFEAHSQTAPVPWQTAFWFWSAQGEAVTAKVVPDLLYFEAGSISREQVPPYLHSGQQFRWTVWANVPEALPQAGSYWLVLRCEQPLVPDDSVAGMIADRVSGALVRARSQHLVIAGIQLDIDAPTADLPHYASFLKEVRHQLPSGLQLSVTALLDWFRDGTAVGDVIAQTDEFVPQFYDVAGKATGTDWQQIAARIDPAKWGPRFNRFGKRFRIGISTFGRSRYLAGPQQGNSPYFGLMVFADLTPAQLSAHPGFTLQVEHTDTSEIRLEYRANRNVKIGYRDFPKGSGVEFIVPTQDSVRAVVAGAKGIVGNCAGVVFFRWPARNETLTMQPGDALVAAGLIPAEKKKTAVVVFDGKCAAVSCVDLYLQNPPLLAPNAAHYRIRSSVELDYFLPDDDTPVRMAGPAQIAVTVPAWNNAERLRVGRAVSTSPAAYTLEAIP